jgi:hypothetical protein
MLSIGLDSAQPDSAKISLSHLSIKTFVVLCNTDLFLKDIHVHFFEDDYEIINFKDKCF